MPLQATRLVKPDNEAKLGILSTNWLENHNTNITQELSHIYEAFSNFRLVAQIREEMEKVKPNLISLTPGAISS